MQGHLEPHGGRTRGCVGHGVRIGNHVPQVRRERRQRPMSRRPRARRGVCNKQWHIARNNVVRATRPAGCVLVCVGVYGFIYEGGKHGAPRMDEHGVPGMG